MISGFRDFLMRGNVVDLAVAVVIAVAFQAVITVFTESVVYPIVNVFGGAEADGLTWQITSNEGTTIDFGAVITALINFLIIAAVVYFVVVVPFNRLRNLRKTEAEEAAEEENVVLLREIRDLLAAPTSAGGPTGTTPPPSAGSPGIGGDRSS